MEGRGVVAGGGGYDHMMPAGSFKAPKKVRVRQTRGGSPRVVSTLNPLR